jgi:adenylate cyclase
MPAEQGQPPNRKRQATVLYGDTVFEAEVGERLLDAILAARIEHRHICGGNGFCTSCRIEVLRDGHHLSPVSPLERERLGGQAGRLRLACQTRVHGDVRVRVPPPEPTRFGPNDGSDEAS